MKKDLIKPENIKNLDDVAKYFLLKPKTLSYILYHGKDDRITLYTEYDIPKKNGSVRKIAAPKEELASLQYKLASYFSDLYIARPSAHGYVNDRSIKTNALAHKNRKFVLNIDLKDFFGSINFGRVRGMLIAAPYGFCPEVATIFSQIACFKNALPQGAPSSPIISNMICSKLDGMLQRFAKEMKCTYTRYADDISISTNLSEFPRGIAEIKDGKVNLSKRLVEIVSTNGFYVNEKKVYLQNHLERQVVTGLVVNEFVNVKRSYVRNLRSALYKWEKFGLEAASVEYFEKFQAVSQGKKAKDYKRILRGRIEYLKMVRKSDDPRLNTQRMALFYKLLNKFYENSLRDYKTPVVRTEGKTDWMHLKVIYDFLKSKGGLVDLNLEFHSIKDTFFYGSSIQMSFCEKVKNEKIRPFNNKIICLFDHDENNVKKIHARSEHKYWGGNVYSTTVCVPEIAENSNASIEMLYGDLSSIHVDGLRLFLSNEFDMKGIHKKDRKIVYEGNLEKLKGSVRVIDADVVDAGSGKKLSITKYNFAKAAQKNRIDLSKIDLSKFESLFLKFYTICLLEVKSDVRVEQTLPVETIGKVI